MVHSGDESEEQRRQREAREAGEAFGSLAGLAVGVAIGLAQQESIPDEENGEDEDESFDITM